jgi:hypothetical protein
MPTTVEGIYRNGCIELSANPTDVPEGTRAIVTFIKANDIDLNTQGIDPEQAELLRASLETFSDDWDSPEMNIYDHYDAAKANR